MRPLALIFLLACVGDGGGGGDAGRTRADAGADAAAAGCDRQCDPSVDCAAGGCRADCTEAQCEGTCGDHVCDPIDCRTCPRDCPPTACQR